MLQQIIDIRFCKKHNFVIIKNKKMKKILLCITSILAIYQSINAQGVTATDRPIFSNTGSSNSSEKNQGFKRENVFWGGSITLGYGSGGNSISSNQFTSSSFVIGAIPEIGYTISNFLDVGATINLIYSSQSYPSGYSEVTRSTFNYGMGLFARANISDQFFLQAMPEINWVDYKATSPGYTGIRQTIQSNSLLVGIGYGQRNVGDISYFTTLLIDVGKDNNSPYLTTGGIIVPVLRGGVSFYLGRKRR
jgi:hypothetical protein